VWNGSKRTKRHGSSFKSSGHNSNTRSNPLATPKTDINHNATSNEEISSVSLLLALSINPTSLEPCIQDNSNRTTALIQHHDLEILDIIDQDQKLYSSIFSRLGEMETSVSMIENSSKAPQTLGLFLFVIDTFPLSLKLLF
jgi:hypothetical protein